MLLFEAVCKALLCYVFSTEKKKRTGVHSRGLCFDSVGTLKVWPFYLLVLNKQRKNGCLGWEQNGIFLVLLRSGGGDESVGVGLREFRV